MNKLTKAAIAGAAGIALLLGGAGSLAYWNSSTGVGSGSVTAGELSIALDGSPTSTVQFLTKTPDAFTGTTKIVPGDTVLITQNVTLTAVGDHLRVDLAIDDALVTGADDLLDQTNITIVAYDGAGGTGAVVTPTTTMTAATAASIKSVVVKVVFDSATDEQVAQTQSIDLSDLKLTVTQVPIP